MATKATLSHLERTAEEPRNNELHSVVLHKIHRVTDTIRLFHLKPIASGRQAISFKPGQWLDVYVPGVAKAGGFTITSPPSVLQASDPYLELAVQKAPANPSAAWLWSDEQRVIGQQLKVRVGGSFVWPPAQVKRALRKVVFIAGGVGINPLMSMVSSIVERKLEHERLGVDVKFLYMTKSQGYESLSEILFLERLKDVFTNLQDEGELILFLTGNKLSAKSTDGKLALRESDIVINRRRITTDDLMKALGTVNERKDTACYICGVPSMTDEFVDVVKKADGMDPRNVLFEKWW